MHVRLTMKSGNAKTGPIPVSTTVAESCPSACPLIGKCYAASGPIAKVWREVTKYGAEWTAFVSQIALLAPGQAWRHNQAGDLPGQDNAIDAQALAELVTANKGKLGFTYTHKPVVGAEYAANAAAVRDANAHGFTINLSANTLAEADTLSDLAIAPVVVLLDAHDGERADTVTPAGRRVVTCPATYRDDISCGGGRVKLQEKGSGYRETTACLLCARVKRQTIVGFPVHGTYKKAAAAVARGEAV